MIFAIYDFTPLKKELSIFYLRELLNIEDLNPSIFDEVFTVLKPYQQEQYILFRESAAAKKYREKRNAKLPYVDLNNLPEIFDNILLQKIMEYQKDGEVKRAISDLLSKDHKNQITDYECKRYEAKRALMPEMKKRKEKEWRDKYNTNPTPRFMGNMGEPANADEYVLRYGRNPFTGEQETIKSFYEKYTIDPHGIIIPKENNP